jgi:hypothetical protein
MAATVQHALTSAAWTIISTGKDKGTVNHVKGANVILTQVVGSVAPLELSQPVLATLKRGANLAVFGLGLETDYLAARSIGANAEITFTEAVE